MMPELPPPHAAQREPNAEDYMAWMIQRCSRRRDNAESHDRRRLYEERVTILHGLVSAMRSPVEALRRAALRTIATSDINDDEGSPSFRAINAPTSLSDAQRAMEFLRAMHGGATSSQGSFPTNVDMVANALGRGTAWPPSPTDSSDELKTESQRRERYIHSDVDEVSDPEYWALLQYGPPDSDSG